MAPIDEIINEFRGYAENRIPVDPSVYLTSAQKLNILRQDLDEELVEAEMVVNAYVNEFMEQGNMSFAGAKVKVQSMECYRFLLILRAKQTRVEEFIRLAKKQASLQVRNM